MLDEEMLLFNFKDVIGMKSFTEGIFVDFFIELLLMNRGRFVVS